MRGVVYIARYDDGMKSKHVIGAVALAIVLAWLLWPSPYSRVKNLGSRGATIVAFGDSLTAGYGAEPGEDYPTRLAAMTNVPIVNAGKSGDTTESALARIDEVIANNPRIVIVGLGGNDFLNGVAIQTTEANLRTIIGRLQSAGAMVVLLGFQFPSITANYDKMYKRIADDEHCLLIRNTLSGILTDPALRSDQIHPNARGYDLMAQRMAGPFRKLLRKAGDE